MIHDGRHITKLDPFWWDTLGPLGFGLAFEVEGYGFQFGLFLDSKEETASQHCGGVRSGIVGIKALQE